MLAQLLVIHRQQKPIIVQDSSQPGIELVYYHADICSCFLLRGTDTWRSGNSLQVKVDIVNERELVLQRAEWQQRDLSRRHIHKPGIRCVSGQFQGRVRVSIKLEQDTN